jgi:hypothetical protein
MLDHDKAMKLWEHECGKATAAHDCKTRLVYKGAYGQHGPEFGWDVHHKRPKSQGGTDASGNLQIVRVITHDEIHSR